MELKYLTFTIILVSYGQCHLPVWTAYTLRVPK